MEEEILSHLPTKNLARLRSVGKRWNTLFKERRFFNKERIYGEGVEWVSLMSVLVPQWSSLGASYYPPSYYLVDEDKTLTLVMCCYNKEGKANIYIAKGEKFDEIEIKDLFEYYHPRHRTYFPSLVQVPTFTMSQHQVGDRTVEVCVGVGGDEWDDGFFDNVNKIIVDFNYFGIVFIKIYYCNGNVVVAGAARGGDSIETRGFLVAEDDYIEAVEGTYTESYITSIAFRSHKGNKSGSLGFFEGKSFALGGGRGSKIIGFYGRSSHLQLTALGVRLEHLWRV